MPNPRTLAVHAALRPLPPLLLAITMALASLGCAFGEFRPGDPFDRQYTLDEAQHRYTTLVRFSDFERARNFITKDERDAFMEQMKALAEARFTDYDSGPAELDSKKATATVKVTYTIYTPSVPFEFEVSETQVWSRDGLSNDWHVSSTFEGLQNLARN